MSARFVDNKEKAKMIVVPFRAIEAAFVEVSRLKIPHEEVMVLKNGNLRIFGMTLAEENQQENLIKKIGKEIELSKKMVTACQLVKAQKRQDMPFIQRVVSDGERSDRILEQLAQYFYRNRFKFPYLDSIIPNDGDELDLFNACMQCITRGYSPTRKREFENFSTSLSQLKNQKEQLAILKNPNRVKCVREIKETVEKNLERIQIAFEEIERIEKEVYSTLTTQELFEIYRNKYMPKCEIKAEQVFKIRTKRQLFAAAKNIQAECYGVTIKNRQLSFLM